MLIPFPPDKDDPRKFGVDVSRFQGDIDFNKMAMYSAPPVEYIMIRSGQGRVGSYDDLDNKFYYNWLNSKEHFPRMAYHVLYPSVPAYQQVANVNRIFKEVEYDFGEGPLWIDFELTHDLDPVSLTSACKAFYDALVAEFDIRVGIYSGYWFLQKCRPAQWWADVDWWLAHYWTSEEHDGPPDRPAIVPADRVIFHQTTSWIDGPLLGVSSQRLDANRYQGDNLYEYLDYDIPEPAIAYADWFPTVGVRLEP